MSIKPHVQIIVLLAAAFLSYAFFAPAPQPRIVPVAGDMAMPAAQREKLPALTFFDNSGKAMTLDDFKGKAVLVNVWATWCPPCVAELAALDTLQARLRGAGLEVVAISVDRTSARTVAAFMRGRGIENLHPYWDRKRQVPAKWRYAGIPVSYLVDREGYLVETFNGPREWDKGALFEKIKAFALQP